MAIRDLNNIVELQDLARFLSRVGWEMHITSCGIEIVKPSSKLCMVFYLNEMVNEYETASFDVYFNEFVLDLNSQEAIGEALGDLTWEELMDELKTDYVEMVGLKEYTHNWINERV